MHHGDGQGLPMQRPSPDGDDERNRIHQPALFKVQQLVNGVRYLDVGNLYDRRWQCKFLQMVLQYRRLCLSCRLAKSVFSVFKFCLYKVYRV